MKTTVAKIYLIPQIMLMSFTSLKSSSNCNLLNATFYVVLKYAIIFQLFMIVFQSNNCIRI